MSLYHIVVDSGVYCSVVRHCPIAFFWGKRVKLNLLRIKLNLLRYQNLNQCSSHCRYRIGDVTVQKHNKASWVLLTYSLWKGRDFCRCMSYHSVGLCPTGNMSYSGGKRCGHRRCVEGGRLTIYIPIGCSIMQYIKVQSDNTWLLSTEYNMDCMTKQHQ